MKTTAVDPAQLHELLYQALETELGGVKVYETALRCAVNKDLHTEWQEYLEQTRTHVEVVTNVFQALGLDTGKMTPGRKVVAHLGESLVAAMEMALAAGDKAAAELVACECVVLAETKDHANWELIGHVAEHGKGEESKVLKAAFDAVSRTRTITCTTPMAGPGAVDPVARLRCRAAAAEEVKQVETAIGASRAEQARDEMLKH